MMPEEVIRDLHRMVDKGGRVIKLLDTSSGDTFDVEDMSVGADGIIYVEFS